MHNPKTLSMSRDSSARSVGAATWFGLALAFLLAWGLAGAGGWRGLPHAQAGSPHAQAGPSHARAEEVDRSPVDLLLSPDEQFLFTANQTSDSVSLVEVASGRVLSEVSCGHRPNALALTSDGGTLLVTGAYSGTLTFMRREGNELRIASQMELGFEPHSVVLSTDGRLAYVSLSSAGTVAVVDVASQTCLTQIEVGQWPRSLALSPDGTRLAVSTSGDQGVAVVDTVERKRLYQERFSAINVGQMQISADGRYVYFPWMIYRQNPINPRNIQAGWVLGSRIARVRLDGPSRREAITLDPQGKAVSDPYGMTMTSDGEWLVSSASGTHELLVYHLPKLTFQDFGGPGDHIDPMLLVDHKRFYRVDLGGRPMAIRMARDNRRVFVANYLSNSVQVVDLQDRAVVQTIDLGSAQQASLARQGEAIFYDGRRSLDQWYSCHSCHYEGGSNATAMDTLNDGTVRTFKTVLSLYHVNQTAPWTWHGWQTDLTSAMRKSMTETMQGPEPSDEDVEALLAFLTTMEPPPNPYRAADGTLGEAATRGQAVFMSERAGCATCHSGEYFTDGLVHDVGLGSPNDAYEGYNTPSLIGVHRKVRLLHDGRAKSLRQVLTGAHNPETVTGQGALSEEELNDLIEYLKTL